MKNRTSPFLSATMLCLITLSLNCASLQAVSPPQLENRTLRLSLDVPGFEYQYEVCAAHFLGICTKHEMKKEIYDLRDPEMRKKLIDMGFVARVKEKVQ